MDIVIYRLNKNKRIYKNNLKLVVLNRIESNRFRF